MWLRGEGKGCLSQSYSMGFGNSGYLILSLRIFNHQENILRSEVFEKQINFIPFGQDRIQGEDYSIIITAYLGISPSYRNTFSHDLVPVKFSQTLDQTEVTPGE